MIRFGQGIYGGEWWVRWWWWWWGVEDRDDRRPPDSWLQAVWRTISCCFICHFVDGSRRTNAVRVWQGGLGITPISAATEHTVLYTVRTL